MKWEDMRKAFPNQWILLEAIDAYTNEKNERILVDIVPLEKFPDSPKAMKAYQKLHHEKVEHEIKEAPTKINSSRLLGRLSFKFKDYLPENSSIFAPISSRTR